MGLLAALIILAFFIVFHELGHFIVARMCGVKVEVFSLGFGKKLLVFEYKGTQYAISVIPLGGYVQLKGQQEAFTHSKQSAGLETNDKDSFLAKSPWQRIAILIAGSGFNFLLGFLLYLCVCIYGITSVPPIVGEVVDSMPAQEAGISRGDRILNINSVEIHTWEEFSKIVQDSEGMISLRVQSGNVYKDITLMPRLVESKNVFGELVWHNAIGVSATQQVQIVRYTGLQAIIKAWEKTIEASKLILQSLQKLISGALGVQHISSVVGITHTMSSLAQSDLVVFFALSALISINLGIFNLLPIPPLDGGHILLTLYETIVRKKPNERIANALMLAGLALLLGVMMIGVYNDINRIIAP